MPAAFAAVLRPLQALVVTTLGGREDAQRNDSILQSAGAPADDTFYLQYFFPPSCVGEVGKVGVAGGWAR